MRESKKNFDLTIVALLVTLAVSIGVVTLILISMFAKPKNTVEPVDATIQASTSETTTQAELKTVNIDVCMIGDMLMHATVYNTGLQSDGSYNFDHLFKHITADVKASDISIVNQETILGGEELGYSSYPCFNTPQELGDAEVKAGFNVILHATNHTFDKRDAGVEGTLNYWETNHPDIAVLGLYENEEESEEIYIYEKDGFKVAILNYTYGTNGMSISSSAPYEINLLEDEDVIKADIAKAKSLADMVIVCPHWGTEYVYSPTEEQKRWTNIFLESGVDVVIGTHPHVLQPVEMLSREDGHQMLVYYSLGNFASWQDEVPMMLGGLAKFTLTKTGDTASISDYSIVPLVSHLSRDSSYTTYKLDDYTDKLASANCVREYGDNCSKYCYCGAYVLGESTHGSYNNMRVDYCKRFCKYVLGDLYNY